MGLLLLAFHYLKFDRKVIRTKPVFVISRPQCRTLSDVIENRGT